MQLQQLSCLLTLVLKGCNGELPGSVQPKLLSAQNNGKDVMAAQRHSALFTAHQWPSLFFKAVCKHAEQEAYPASPQAPDKWMWWVMSRKGRVQDTKEVGLCSPQAARLLDPRLGGRVTLITDSLLLAVVGALQSRTLAPHYNNITNGEEG